MLADLCEVVSATQVAGVTVRSKTVHAQQQRLVIDTCYSCELSKRMALLVTMAAQDEDRKF